LDISKDIFALAALVFIDSRSSSICAVAAITLSKLKPPISSTNVLILKGNSLKRSAATTKPVFNASPDSEDKSFFICLNSWPAETTKANWFLSIIPASFTF